MSDEPAGEEQAGYPFQDLTPQEIRPGPSRRWFWVLAVVVVLAAAAGLAFVLLSGEKSDRDAYCDELRSLADSSPSEDTSLVAVFGSLQRLAELAPDEVADDWATLQGAFGGLSPLGDGDDVGPGVFDAVQHISADASDECGLDLFSDFEG